jgi:hypothetical protein
MALAHVFVETNFLFGVFRMPSKRHRNAVALKARFDAGEVKLYVPYLCFQEARNLIAKSLPSNRCSDLLEFNRFAGETETASWDFGEVKKLLDAATGEVGRTKAVYQRQLSEFAAALGGDILHGTREVFDFLESLDLDDDNLKYNDKLILTSTLLKAKELKGTTAGQLIFASLDKSDLQPTAYRPKLARYHNEAGLVFVPNFELPNAPVSSAGQSPVSGES